MLLIIEFTSQDGLPIFFCYECDMYAQAMVELVPVVDMRILNPNKIPHEKNQTKKRMDSRPS